MASEILLTIASGNDSCPDWHQAISRINGEFFVEWGSSNACQWNCVKNLNIPTNENTSKMSPLN